MGYIRVKYQSNTFDYVPEHLLDTMITFNQITHFYRYADKRWVVLGLDPIRRRAIHYEGPERRKTREDESQKA